MSKEISSFITSSPNIRNGKPRIAGTSITVHRIATWYNMGHTPEEIVSHYPHLNLAKVFTALAYYFNHRETLDAEMAEEQKNAELLEAEFVQSTENL